MSISDETFWTYWSIYMGTIFLIWIFKKDKDDKSPSDKQYKAWRSQFLLKTNKTAYIRAVVYWCVQNLGVPKGNNKIPGIVVRYVKQDKFLGLYCSARKEIIIYIKAHEDLLQLTNTVIHEYDHFLRIRNVNDQKNYNKVLNEIGYDKHPLEIYARETADKHELSCFREMAERGLLFRK